MISTNPNALEHSSVPSIEVGAKTISMYYPVPLTGTWVSHIFLSLAKGFVQDGWSTRVGSFYVNRQEAEGLTIYDIPHTAYRLLCKARISPKLVSDRVFVRKAGDASIAYLWPGTPLWVHEKLKARGLKIVIEMINCHVATSQNILTEVYSKEGLQFPYETRTNAESQRTENERLALCDAVFSPSPNVTHSLLANGVEERKILQSSYGYCPKRLKGVPQARSANYSGKLKFLFVGSGVLRKGLHTLMKAWNQLNWDHELLIAGNIAPEISNRYQSELSKSNVRALGHVNDISGLLSEADVFVFPTFEEGSPLVVYEALAAGLPVISTEMGMGSVVRDKLEGIQVDYFDEDGLAESMQLLDQDRALLTTLSRNAFERAKAFTWSKVANKRSEQLTRLLTC